MKNIKSLCTGKDLTVGVLSKGRNVNFTKEWITHFLISFFLVQY